MTDFHPDRGPDGDEQRMPKEELRAALLETLGEARDYIHRRLREEMGHRYDEAIRSPSATLEHIHDPDPIVRSAAYFLLCSHWPPDHKLEPRYRDTVTSDPEPRVRRSALLCLIALYKGTEDRAVSLMLARMARDSSEHADVRRSAFRGVYEVLKLTMDINLKVKFVEHSSGLPPALDWSVIDDVLAKGEDRR